MTATIVVGLAFGDEGKGTVVDWLSRRSPGATVVRYCGGPQAAHNVVTDDGRHHTFAQFGSGMFVPGTTTHLSRFMMVNPFNMAVEARHLEAVGVPDPWARTTVDPAALVTTPYHKGLNRLRELARGPRRHGSCGQGIGETMADWLERGSDCVLAGDLLFPKNLVRKLGALRAIAGEEAERLAPDAGAAGPAWFDPFAECHLPPIVVAEHYGRVVPSMRFRYDEELSTRKAPLIFEGAQGVLLDQDHGLTPPHVTWSTTTTDNAVTILERCGYEGPLEVLGVLRSYMTRHGAGPFETESPDLNVPEAHNGHGEWQGAWRQGWLDLNVLRYAIDRCGGIDGLVMTHVDRVPREGWPVRTEERPPPYPVFAKDGYAERVADGLGVRLHATSHGPTAADKLVNVPVGRNG